jgi:hypothetical protein
VAAVSAAAAVVVVSAAVAAVAVVAVAVVTAVAATTDPGAPLVFTPANSKQKGPQGPFFLARTYRRNPSCTKNISVPIMPRQRIPGVCCKVAVISQIRIVDSNELRLRDAIACFFILRSPLHGQ